MNASTSECSSGCESGWTRYFDEFSNSNDPYFVKNYQKGGACVNEDDHEEDDHEEDEDLSMVSDASSRPPPHDYDNSQYHYNEYENSVSEGKKKNKQKNKTKEPKISKKQQSLCLDDTASSPIFNFSQENDNNHAMEHVPGYSQAYSSTHLESDSVTRKHFGLFKSSTKGKSGSLLGRKRQ